MPCVYLLTLTAAAVIPHPYLHLRVLPCFISQRLVHVYNTYAAGDAVRRTLMQSSHSPSSVSDSVSALSAVSYRVCTQGVVLSAPRKMANAPAECLMLYQVALVDTHILVHVFDTLSAIYDLCATCRTYPTASIYQLILCSAIQSQCAPAHAYICCRHS